MTTLQITRSVSGIGGAISASFNRTADGGSAREVSIPAGKAGTLSTRTDNETGTLTLGSGHGIVTGQIIDLYWATGARYGITVGTVSGSSVPIGADNSGSGSNLPTAATAIVASPRVNVEVPLAAANMQFLAVQMLFSSPLVTSAGVIRFFDVSSTEIITIALEAGVPKIYDIIGGDDIPFGGDISAYAFVSHGFSAAAATLKMLWIEDTTN